MVGEGRPSTSFGVLCRKDVDADLRRRDDWSDRVAQQSRETSISLFGYTFRPGMR
jgi:hypothetical protein